VYLETEGTILNRIAENFVIKALSLFWQNVEPKTAVVWEYIVGLLSVPYRGCTRIGGFEFVMKNTQRFMKRS
jgi:hypothetical protein